MYSGTSTLMESTLHNTVSFVGGSFTYLLGNKQTRKQAHEWNSIIVESNRKKKRRQGGRKLKVLTCCVFVAVFHANMVSHGRHHATR